jgi:hypothetical protein
MYNLSIQPSFMMRQPVSSGNLQSVGYDPNSQILEVEFNSGSIYQYTGVPGSVYQGLMGASSHGSYFAQNIRDRYPYTRIR